MNIDIYGIIFKSRARNEWFCSVHGPFASRQLAEACVAREYRMHETKIVKLVVLEDNVEL